MNTIQDKTRIQLFVTIEPQLQPAPPMPEKFETNESDALLHNAQLWLSAVRSKYPKRTYKVMASDLDGKKIFVTRYIRPQNPPEELILENDIPELHKMHLLARYVSMIPYIADSVRFPDLCDIWTASDVSVYFSKILEGKNVGSLIKVVKILSLNKEMSRNLSVVRFSIVSPGNN